MEEPHTHKSEHGHHHHHGERAVDELPSLTATFEGHEHEDAAAISCTLRMREGHALPFQVLVEVLTKAGEALEGAGAFIGHAKALASNAGETASASLTDLAVGPTVQGDRDLVLDANAQAQVVAIVVGLPLQEAFDLFHESMRFTA